MWRWGNDIYKTGYRIFTLYYIKCLRADCYLFHYPKGSSIPRHKDPKKYGPHYRLNFEIRRPKKGGKFHSEKTVFSLFDRVHLFRADKYYHYVTEVEEGSRYVLSFGFTNIFAAKPRRQG